MENIETPELPRRQFDEMLGKHAEQKQELENKQAEEKRALIDEAHEKALDDNKRLEDLRQEMVSITGERVEENSLEQLKQEWQKFYQETFNIETNFSQISVPEKQEGFERLLILAMGMKAQQLFDKCRELFPTWKYTEKDLDVTSDRNADEGAYAIWVREVQEADEQLKNLSANDIKEKNITTETLEERLLDEIKYFKQMGKHLDVENVTLCAGSHDSDGDVPHVHFRGDKMHVNRRGSDYYFDFLRARQAVS